MLTRRSSGADIINFPPILHCFVCFSSATLPTSRAGEEASAKDGLPVFAALPHVDLLPERRKLICENRARDELSVERCLRALPTHATTTSAAGELLLSRSADAADDGLENVLFFRGKLINFENRTDDVVVARADRSPRLFGFNYAGKKKSNPRAVSFASLLLDKRESVAARRAPKQTPNNYTVGLPNNYPNDWFPPANKINRYRMRPSLHAD